MLASTYADETVPMPRGPISGPSAWYGPAMARSKEWVYPLTNMDIAEIEAAIGANEKAGQAMGDISPGTFELPTLGPKLNAMLDEILHGRGFLVVRGFPVDRYSIEQTAIGYLGLGSYFGSFRSQNAKGHLLGHVKDLGLDISKPTTRYYQTTKQLKYHTDSCDIVGLICLKTAKAGGESGLVSSVTIFNEILKRRPDLLPQLFHSFPTDRRGEVPPGMKPWFDVPVFSWYAGKLTTIYAGQYIHSAQKLFPEARRLSEREFEALQLFDDLADDPELRLLTEFQPGDMQFLHNHQILHSRTDFEDWPEPERRRHLLRLWLAPKGARPLPPCFAARYGSLTPGDRGGIITKDIKLKFVLEAE
jgi:hypothetical protein